MVKVSVTNGSICEMTRLVKTLAGFIFDLKCQQPPHLLLLAYSSILMHFKSLEEMVYSCIVCNTLKSGRDGKNVPS